MEISTGSPERMSCHLSPALTCFMRVTDAAAERNYLQKSFLWGFQNIVDVINAGENRVEPEKASMCCNTLTLIPALPEKRQLGCALGVVADWVLFGCWRDRFERLVFVPTDFFHVF